MHASIEQLLDYTQSPASGGSAEETGHDAVDRAHVASCELCQGELKRIDALRARLRGLPEAEPAQRSEDATWAAIKKRAGATRGRDEASKRSHDWLPLGLAASLLVATLVAVLASWPGEQVPAVAITDVPTRTVPETAALVQRSQQLEQILGSLRYEPRVVSARTAGTIAQLEDQIAWIDYGLGEGSDGRLSEQDANALWRQRVELMNSLVHVRYAQAQRVDF